MGTTGVVVGKFNPPHLGHLHLISEGARQVDRLFVLLCDRPDQTLAIEARRAWIEDASPPNVTVIVTQDDLPAANEPWAERTLAALPTSPDIAFTSEAWGPGWAELMGARHIEVDQPRATFPISGTDLRNNLKSNFHWLLPAARADLARRVVLCGAESTGKSTLAEALAQELGTVWVPEHGRFYWEGRRHLADQSWTTDEFLRIAQAQRRLEDDLARLAVGGVMIADTDAMVASVWHERYLHRPSNELRELAADQAPDLYLVCSPDFDWVQDGTRESQDHRFAMHDKMLAGATMSCAEVTVLTGGHAGRLDAALKAVNDIAPFQPLT